MTTCSRACGKQLDTAFAPLPLFIFSWLGGPAATASEHTSSEFCQQVLF